MSVFYVYQGDRYEEECKGGYVWSPKYAINGSRNAGYKMMSNIRRGDFILHNCKGKIMAVSIAKVDCYDAEQPDKLHGRKSGGEWEDEGYRVDTNYLVFDIPLVVTKYKAWLAAHYKQDSAFTVKGTGKQQYMCSINDKQAIYLLEKAIALQSIMIL